MSKKIIQFAIACNYAVHSIVPGYKQSGVKVGLNEDMYINHWIQEIEFNKKQA